MASTQKLVLNIPSSLLKKAKEKGISLEKIKSSTEDFIILELTASIARVNRNSVLEIDKIIKGRKTKR